MISGTDRCHHTVIRSKSEQSGGYAASFHQSQMKLGKNSHIYIHNSDSLFHTPHLCQLRSELIKGEMGRFNIPPFPRSWEEPAPGGSEENNGRKLGDERGSSCWQDDAEDERDDAPHISGHRPAALCWRNWAL